MAHRVVTVPIAFVVFPVGIELLKKLKYILKHAKKSELKAVEYVISSIYEVCVSRHRARAKAPKSAKGPSRTSGYFPDGP